MKKLLLVGCAALTFTAKFGVAAEKDTVAVEDLKIVEETVAADTEENVAQHGGHHHHGGHGGHHGGHWGHGGHHHHHHHHHWSGALSSNVSTELPSPTVQL